MSTNANEVTNFEQLMEKYIKDKNQILSKYDYHTPLKEIAPIEPLVFENDILQRNNTNQDIINQRNFEPIYDNNNNLESINNNIKKYPYMNNGFDLNENENKFITPLKPITQKNSNSYINSSIEREKALKEEKKKKQMEYRKLLDEQIMSKKERQKKEKEKRLEEERIFEEKFKLENEKYEQQKISNNKQYKNISNLFSEENSQQVNSNSNNLISENNNINNNNNNQENEFDEKYQNELNSNRNNVLRRNKSQQYFDVMNNNNLFPNIPNQKYQISQPYMGIDAPNQELKENNQIFQNQPQSNIPIEHLVSTSTQIPAQFLNPRNQNFIRPPYKTQNNYYPASRQNLYQNLNLNYNQNQVQSPPQQQEINQVNPYLTQRQYNEFHTQPKLQGVSSDQGLNTNNSISPSNFPTCYPMPFNNNLMNSSPNVNFNNNSQNANELFNMNINNQNYFGKIIEMFFHEQEKILESYKETIEKLKNERDEAIYRNRANEEKILALQKMQSDQELLEKNLGYFPLKKNYQQNMERTLDSIMQKNENEIEENNLNNINNKNDIKINKNEQSMNNLNDNSNISDSKIASLITSTKFVKVNNGEDKELLETWKKEEREEKSKNKKNKKLPIENNNEINKKNKFRFNGMDTNSFMEKINSINNKILEPPEEPQKYLNVNNLSLISKTQKIDEKSFTNEISNINSNKDNSNNNIVNNINTEENIVNNMNNNNIDITDNTNIKEDISYYTKKEKDDSDLNSPNNNNNNSEVEIKNKDIMLNNVNNIVMENLDNNISYSTQLKEKLEQERKLQENKKIGNTSEKEDKISHFTEVEKTKYKDYTFKQLNFSNTKHTDINQMNKIKLNPNLKNLDNNMTVSSKKKEQEKNPFDNIVSLNDEEEENVVVTDVNNNTNTNKNTTIKNKNKSEFIEEDINDMPNQDSPRVTDSQNFNIQRNTDIDNKNEDSYYSTNKKEEEIMNRMNFFDEDNLSPKIKLEKKPSEINQKFNNINLELNNSSYKDNSNINQMNNQINQINNSIQQLSKNSIRPLSNLSKEKITSLNNLYDEFKKKKDTLNETNNSIVNKSVHNNNNFENNNSLLNESLNTFTQNLNKKWKDLTREDIKNLKNIKEKNYTEETSNNNNIENNNSLECDKFEDEKIFDKVNQFTRVALNELKQSQLSIFNKEKTIKKFN